MTEATTAPGKTGQKAKSAIIAVEAVVDLTKKTPMAPTSRDPTIREKMVLHSYQEASVVHTAAEAEPGVHGRKLAPCEKRSLIQTKKLWMFRSSRCSSLRNGKHIATNTSKF